MEIKHTPSLRVLEALVENLLDSCVAETGITIQPGEYVAEDPEQIGGEILKGIDDVFGLGLSLFHKDPNHFVADSRRFRKAGRKV